jgi:AcrR family transcriptional regulator
MTEQLRADARQNRARLIAAATAAFAEKGADASLEDIARRAGVGIGTLYRHFPTRVDLLAEAFRAQVNTLCGSGHALLANMPPQDAFITWIDTLARYLVTKHGLADKLMEALGKDNEVIHACWMTMRDTTEDLLAGAQKAGTIRSDISGIDVMRLTHGIVVSSQRAPEEMGRLLSIMLDGLKPQAQPREGGRFLRGTRHTYHAPVLYGGHIPPRPPRGDGDAASPGRAGGSRRGC